MTPTSPDPADAIPEDDLLDQQTPTMPDDPHDDGEPPYPETALPEADDADLAEQATPLPDDENDDYPRTSPDE